MTNEFGKRLRVLRLSKDLSLRDLAELSGISFSFIGSLERGTFNPSRDTIKQLSEVLDADADELLVLAGFLPDDVSQIAAHLEGEYGEKDVEQAKFIAQIVRETIKAINEEKKKEEEKKKKDQNTTKD